MPTSLFKKLAFIAVLVLIATIFIWYNNRNKEVPKITEIIKEEPVATPRYKIIGHSVNGRELRVYTYGTGSTSLLFVGGIHGGYEWNSVLLAYTFIDHLESHPEVIPKNLTVHVLPSANPDGVYRVTGKDGRFTSNNPSTDKDILASGRFNANNVDLNRNFDCKWQPKSTWRSKTVDAGASVFSEPEAKALRDFIKDQSPSLVVFWHSQANGVYASQCEKGILPETITAMNLYSGASGYKAIKTFDAYQTTGAAEDWLASINIPALTVELSTHETIEWEKNMRGINALLEYYKK